MSNRISQLRKQNNMTQKQLADLVGVSPSAIGMYEQLRRDPDTKTLISLAKIFNVSVDYLIGKTDIKEYFDVDEIAKSIAADLVALPNVLQNAQNFSREQLEDLQNEIEQAVRISISQRK